MNTPTPGLPVKSLLLAGAFALGCLPATAADSAPAAAPTPIPLSGPSVSDVATLNAALKKALTTQDPATKAVFDAHPGFKPITGNPAINPAPYSVPRHNGFVAGIPAQGDTDLLFIGDSITDFWRDNNAANKHNGKAIFDQYFGSLKVANFGISGDTTQGVLWRLQNGEGQGFKTKAIMMMIGTNNVSNRAMTAPDIADGIISVVGELRKDFPTAKILLLGIFPRATPGDPMRKTIADINTIIAKMDDGKNIFYRDIGPKFLDAAGIIQPDIMADASPLHPTEKGYVIWAEAVKDTLASLMKGEAPAK